MSIRKSPARFTIPKLTYRVWKVWHRNFDVFLKTIKVNFLPSLLEPILYLLAFGFGLGGFIPSIQGQSYIALYRTSVGGNFSYERLILRMHFRLVRAYVLPKNI